MGGVWCALLFYMLIILHLLLSVCLLNIRRFLPCHGRLCDGLLCFTITLSLRAVHVGRDEVSRESWYEGY